MLRHFHLNHFQKNTSQPQNKTALKNLFRRSVALTFLLGTAAFNAQADNSSIAYVWANQPSTASYTPSTTYTLASNPVLITRSAVGTYQVSLGSIVAFGGGTGGNVQVSAYGATSDRCKVSSWAGANVNVRCHDVTGNLSDSQFTVLFNRASAITEDVAYAWADSPAEASYTPNSLYSHGQDPISITRNAVGDYSVSLGSIANNSDGNVQVTAYGGNSDYCNVRNWGGGIVNVRCYDTAGALSDSRFTVLFSRVEGTKDNIAYAWANFSNNEEYTPSTLYSYSNDPITISRSSVGNYSVNFGTLPEFGGNVQVTAYGSSNNTCSVRRWTSVVEVRCYDVSGNPVDQVFTVLFRDAGVSDTRSEVDIVSSCLAGNGRVDVNIVNSVTALSRYRLEFEGLSARETSVAFEDWGRLRLTGRLPGTYSVVVKRDGTTIVDKEIEINCGATIPAVGTAEVRILNACRATGGYVLFQMVNPSSAVRPYVIEFEGVPNRSTSAAEFGQTVRATSGRPNGTYAYRVRTGSSTVNRGELTVDCS